MNQKGMTVSVYRNAQFNSDFSRNGVSAQSNELFLIGPGVPELFENRDGLPIVKLVERNLWGTPYFHVEPVDRPTGNGWMFGGNFVYCSDSRFRRLTETGQPIPVHDRQE